MELVICYTSMFSKQDSVDIIFLQYVQNDQAIINPL